jgi:methionyl-tRNA synthetase
MFLPDRFIRVLARAVTRRTSTATRVKLRSDLFTDRIEKRGLGFIRCAAGGEGLGHYFSNWVISDLAREWLHPDITKVRHVQPEVANKLSEWFDAGLKDWDISRDAPYFGFEIPDTPGKYFYVWLDAPVGYMASLKNLCAKKGLKFDDFWGKDSSAELYHFIGKDILYFHTLFWPAMLEGAGFRKPTSVFAHGFLTINGTKMSKSRGTFITARSYLNHLHPRYLRYYFAAKLNGRVEDIDLNFDDFTARINSNLIGKYVNIASRAAGFVTERFGGKLSKEPVNKELLHETRKAAETIVEHYENRDYAEAVRLIMSLADKANAFVDDHKPRSWPRTRRRTSICSRSARPASTCSVC